MSEVDFREIGPNERIEPLPIVKPLHLHERTAAGLTGKKDPTANILTGGRYEPSPFDLPEMPWPEFPPPMMFDPIWPPFEIPPLPPGPIIPGPAEGVPPSPPTPGAFVYLNGAWWAAVELDCDTGELTEPYWFQFAPNCSTPITPELLAALAPPDAPAVPIAFE